MPSNVMTHRALEPAEITAVGIDVGGEQKGFHAVALIGGSYACQFTTKDVPELSRWSSPSMPLAAGAMTDVPAPPNERS